MVSSTSNNLANTLGLGFGIANYKSIQSYMDQQIAIWNSSKSR